MRLSKYPTNKPCAEGYYMFKVNGRWQPRWFDGLDVNPRWAGEKDISHWRELTPQEQSLMPN